MNTISDDLEIIEKYKDEYRKRFNTKMIVEIADDLMNMIMSKESYKRELENLIILNIYEGLNKE